MKKIVLFTLIISGLFAETNCAMCHNGGYQMKLDNFTSTQIKEMMIDFKNGKKPGMNMPGITKNMSDEEIEKVAKEYGKK